MFSFKLAENRLLLYVENISQQLFDLIEVFVSKSCFVPLLIDLYSMDSSLDRLITTQPCKRAFVLLAQHDKSYP